MKAMLFAFLLCVAGQSSGIRPPLLLNDGFLTPEDVAQERKLTYIEDKDDFNINNEGDDETLSYIRRPSPPSNSVRRRRPFDCRSKTRTLPHEKHCDLYHYTTDCDDGQALLRSCPNGLVYTGSGRHGLLGVCDYPHNVDCRGKTMNTKAKIVPDVDYCDRYWECLDGQAELYDCPNGLVWVGKNRGIADGCDYPWRNPSLCQGKDLANPPISTEHCDWLYGIFGHETSCTRYWTCWNGTATEQFCVGGLLYNEETHACDWPQNVLGCQKHPLCKDDANGNVPLGKSCNRYWACQGGYPRLQRCPAMLVFDKIRKRCISPPTADCDIPSTTPPPPSQLKGEDNLEPRGRVRPNANNRRRSQNIRPEADDNRIDENPSPVNPPFSIPSGATLIRAPNNA